MRAEGNTSVRTTGVSVEDLFPRKGGIKDKVALGPGEYI